MTHKQHHYRGLLEVEGRGGGVHCTKFFYTYFATTCSHELALSAVRGKTDYLEVAIKL